jgi:hypothetical protein
MECFQKRKIMRKKILPAPYQTSSPKFEDGLWVIFLFLASNFQHPMLKVRQIIFFYSLPSSSKLNPRNYVHG